MPAVGWLRSDGLILALGSGLSSRIPSMSPLLAALRDHAHAEQLAVTLPKLARGKRVLIVGGRLSAIELSAEIAEAHPQLEVELLTQQLGEGLNAAPRDVLAEELRGLGVTIREGVGAFQPVAPTPQRRPMSARPPAAGTLGQARSPFCDAAPRVQDQIAQWLLQPGGSGCKMPPKAALDAASANLHNLRRARDAWHIEYPAPPS